MKLKLKLKLIFAVEEGRQWWKKEGNEARKASQWR